MSWALQPSPPWTEPPWAGGCPPPKDGSLVGTGRPVRSSCWPSPGKLAAAGPEKSGVLGVLGPVPALSGRPESPLTGCAVPLLRTGSGGTGGWFCGPAGWLGSGGSGGNGGVGPAGPVPEFDGVNDGDVDGDGEENRGIRAAAVACEAAALEVGVGADSDG